jgi:hypothetical protein
VGRVPTTTNNNEQRTTTNDNKLTTTTTNNNEQQQTTTTNNNNKTTTTTRRNFLDSNDWEANRSERKRRSCPTLVSGLAYCAAGGKVDLFVASHTLLPGSPTRLSLQEEEEL